MSSTQEGINHPEQITLEHIAAQLRVHDSMLSGLRQDVAELRQDVAELRQDVAGLKTELRGVVRGLVDVRDRLEEASWSLRRIYNEDMPQGGSLDPSDTRFVHATPLDVFGRGHGIYGYHPYRFH
jgi:chromosome segregation ATPase